MRLGAAFRNWVAVETETGAHLWVSNGRSRSGTGHTYGIVLPAEGFESRGFNYFAPYDSAQATYSRFKAPTDAEAIAKANQRLSKLLRQRGGQ